MENIGILEISPDQVTILNQFAISPRGTSFLVSVNNLPGYLGKSMDCFAKALPNEKDKRAALLKEARRVARHSTPQHNNVCRLFLFPPLPSPNLC